MRICISGIHTDAGKTHCSAVFCKAFGYDYFKLIQAGSPKDSSFVAQFIPESKICEEGVVLQTPSSPHIAKYLENKHYDGLQIPIPKRQNILIELAGGLFTPLDDTKCMIDFIAYHRLPTFLVGRYYLGCINHILLSIEALRQRDIKILGLIMMRETNPLESTSKSTQIHSQKALQESLMDKFIMQYAHINIIHISFFTRDSIDNALNELKKQIDVESLQS